MEKYPRLSKSLPAAACFLARPLPSIVGIVLVVLASLSSGWVNDYVNTFPPSSESLPDLLHSLGAPVDLNLFVSLVDHLTLVGLLVYFAFWDPKNFAVALILLGVFFLARVAFLYCTVLPTPYPRIDDAGELAIPGVFYGTRDLFPSGHAGSLFALALLLSKHLWLRVLAFVLALSMGVGVILMHVHYTIDVLGAYFIAYAVYAFLQKHVVSWVHKGL